MQALCRLPPTAKSSLPSAADGKEATWQPTVLPGSWPIWSVCLQWQTAKTLPSVADGKEPALCHQWQTAKNLHFAILGRRQRTCHLVTCRWHHTADGKDQTNFAVSGGRQRSAVSHLTDWQRNYCRPPSLPSAADGKEPLPSAARKQTAKQLFTVAFFAGAFCRPRLTAKVFAVRLSSLCRPPWQTAK